MDLFGLRGEDILVYIEDQAVVVDGHPVRRATTIGDACRHTHTAERPVAGLRR